MRAAVLSRTHGSTMRRLPSGRSVGSTPRSVRKKVVTTTFQWDNNGNLIQKTTGGTSTTYVYDYANRLIALGAGGATSTYGYDAFGARVYQIASSTATSTYPFKFFSIASTTRSGTNYATTTEYIFNGDTLLATVDQGFKNGAATGSAATRYVHPDHLGSTNVITNASGTVVSTKDYYPFGSVRVNSGTASLARGFIGEFSDASNLSYLNSRYMEPARGQFLSQDPAFWSEKQNLKNPQSFNTYSYAENNPIAFKDAAGKATYYFDSGRVIHGNDTWNSGSYYQRNDMAMLRSNAERMRDAQPASFRDYGLSEFVRLVQPRGEWDFLSRANEKAKGRGYFFFGDTLYSAEDYGNIHYGYVGTAGGFGPSGLKAGGGLAQIYKKDSMLGWYNSYLDDPRDQENIMRGIAAYNSSLYSQFYTTPSGAVVSAGGVFVQQSPSQGSGSGGSSSSDGGSSQGTSNNGGWGSAHTACGALCM
jgi:RHS repeat-associated protein